MTRRNFERSARVPVAIECIFTGCQEIVYNPPGLSHSPPAATPARVDAARAGAIRANVRRLDNRKQNTRAAAEPTKGARGHFQKANGGVLPFLEERSGCCWPGFGTPDKEVYSENG